MIATLFINAMPLNHARAMEVTGQQKRVIETSSKEVTNSRATETLRSSITGV